MRKHLLILLTLVLAFAMPGHAVLKERNLDTTLVLLRSELTSHHLQLEKESKAKKAEREALFKEVIAILNQANKNSIMLYSQKDGYIFDMAYACHEATEQYKSFKTKSVPFTQSINEVNSRVARYDSLITSLNNMPKQALSTGAQTNRNVCLTLAVNIRRQLVEEQTQLKMYVKFYNMAENRLKTLDNYANKRYAEIQDQIFNNKGDSFFAILTHLISKTKEATGSVLDKYHVSKHNMSQWDVRYIGMLFGIILIWGFVSVAINLLVIRGVINHLIKKGMFASFKDEFYAKRPCIVMAMSVVTFAIILGIIRLLLQNQYFLIMASNLLVEYAWLFGVILISLLLRVEGDQIKSAFQIYTPIIAMSFFVIAFRIVLIPNDLVNLIFPPMLLACAIWQWFFVRKHDSNVPKSDMTYAWTSFLIFVVSVVASWIGYTLLSVQILIWWVMQLTCILSITCITGWIKTWADKHDFANKNITKTWFYNMVYKMLLPIMSVLSFVLSIQWAADVFNLSNTTWSLFNLKFVDIDQVRFSLFDLLQVTVLFFIFKYINNTSNAFVKLHFEKVDKSTAGSRYMMAKNVLQILCWGIWIMVSISILHISNSWFLVISGGLSTGIGFAMKDILENIYYGISLMTGRIKIGDYIVCDGIRGRVSNINYTSTMVEAIDGSIIAFTNSQLFTKNYKNLTRNHGYELDILEVGVAYGTNIEQARKALVESIMKLPCIRHDKGVKVLLKSFDDSCITLKILIWVNVLTQSIDDSKVMECIYETLDREHIDIPFPQRVITFNNVPDNTAAAGDNVEKK